MTPGQKLVELLEQFVAAKHTEMKHHSSCSDYLVLQEVKDELAKEIDHLGGTTT